MMTNKIAQKCADCGEIVMIGKGTLTREFDNYRDEVVWVVRHTDKSVCQTIKAEQSREQSKSNAITNGISYIQRNGEKSAEITDGKQVIYDGRKGYNQVGWLLTRTDNTLYLTSRNNLDGYDTSETYILNATASKIEDLLWTMELI